MATPGQIQRGAPWLFYLPESPEPITQNWRKYLNWW
jgi:hypothetical protein